MEINDFEKFNDYLVKELKIGDRTTAIYLFYYKHFEVPKISQEYINDFVLNHKNTPSVRGFVKNYLEFHGIKDLFTLPKNQRGSKSKKLIRTITPQEMKVLRDGFYSRTFKEGLIFDLIYQGALRIFELTNLKIGCFFFEDWFNDTSKFCKVLIFGKGKKERYILINPETAESILIFYVEKYNLKSKEQVILFFSNNTDKLIFTRNGEKLTEKYIYDLIKKGSKKFIGRDVRPHELRHSRATELEKRGLSAGDIKSYLGHSKISTTEIYLHKSGEESIETIENNLKIRDGSDHHPYQQVS